MGNFSKAGPKIIKFFRWFSLFLQREFLTQFPDMKNEIILYHPEELAEHIEIRNDEETVWLNRKQLATLFDRDIKTIVGQARHKSYSAVNSAMVEAYLKITLTA
jgi:hypothetical protein